MGGVVQMLDAAGIGAERSQRGDSDPLIIAGGPLTFSNPLPLGVFADAIVMGEADELVLDVLACIRDRFEPRATWRPPDRARVARRDRSRVRA